MKFQGHRSNVKVTDTDFQILHHCYVALYCQFS